MIISDLYKTVITCISETKIDTGNINVTVKLKDFNNQPVTGKKVELTVDKGRLNTVTTGSNPSVSSNGKKVNANTNSKGEITVTYTANEWGLVTFTANEDAKTQLLVKGLREESGSSNKINYKIYTDGQWCHTHISALNLALESGGGNDKILGTIPLKYVPKQLLSTFGHHARLDIIVSINPDGEVIYRLSSNTGSLSSQSLYCGFTYNLLNPLY